MLSRRGHLSRQFKNISRSVGPIGIAHSGFGLGGVEVLAFVLLDAAELAFIPLEIDVAPLQAELLICIPVRNPVAI